MAAELQTAPLRVLEHPAMQGHWRCLGMRAAVSMRKTVIYALHRRLVGAARTQDDVDNARRYNPMTTIEAAAEDLWQLLLVHKEAQREGQVVGTSASRHPHLQEPLQFMSQLARSVLPRIELSPCKYEEYCAQAGIDLFGTDPAQAADLAAV
jgi:hypothetical protein